VSRLSAEEIRRYDLVEPAIAARAVLVQVPLLPPRAAGMTSGRFVLLRGDHARDGTSQLIAHELVHVRQFAERGRLWFALTYVFHYLCNLARYRRHHPAYRHIPHEVEAYDAAALWAARQRRRPAPSTASAGDGAAPQPATDRVERRNRAD
jgi:hypothetical protein